MKPTATYLELRNRYVRIRAMTHSMRVSETGMLLLMVGYVILFFADMIVALPSNRPLLHIVRIGTILACLEYLSLAKRTTRRALVLAQLIHYSVVGIGAVLLHRAILGGTDPTLAVPAGYVLTFSFILTMGAPARGPWVLFTAIGYVVMVFAACVTPTGDQTHLAVITTYVIATAAMLHFVTDTLAEGTARAEIDLRLQLAPLDIVRSAVVNRNEHMGFELARQRRRCLCLASDWRGYQALSRSTPPESLQVVLGAYYEMCRALLAKCVPTGEYFSDWIADELLIFFVADDASRIPELTRTALAFARELIEAKTAFSEEHGIPYGIDVGLAAGEATIGLFGPRRNRKVMAVGQVAVDARRLQAVGKQLRYLRGETDRIVYTDALYTLAGAPAVATPLDERHPLHVDAPPVGVLFEEPGLPPALLKISA